MRRALGTLVLVGLGACQPKVATDTCPRDGTVPGDMRDVERDAEGIAYALFGPAPNHIADYDRARAVFSLLQTVWSNAKTACPDLPVDRVGIVDEAIGRIATAIPAQDQRGGAYAGNDIHQQMGPLFSYFNRPKPDELEQMDAMFLRVGLDAWYGDWTAYQANLDALNVEWVVVKPTVLDLGPSCHRVSGTASVADDVDQTLAALATAGSARDVAAAQIGSDDGLLQVDIIEQLYDCPPDSETPDAGLGSACTATDQCGGAGLVCDLDNAGGRCAPDAADTRIGQTCVTTVDCGTYARDACNNEVGDGFPGGYCVMEPCNDVQVCSPGATCVAQPFETPACMLACVVDTDCRASDGYVCQLYPTTPPIGFGPTDHACGFACTSDEECTSPLTCDVASGKCQP